MTYRPFEKQLAAITRRVSLLPGVWTLIKLLLRFYPKLPHRDDAVDWTIIQHGDGSRMKVDRSGIIGYRLFWFGYHSVRELRLLGRVLQPGMVFADIGANQGEFTLYAARRVGAGGKVISFEPIPAIYGHLSENIRLNNLHNVQAFNCGLSDAPGTFTMYTTDNNESGMGSLYPDDEHPRIVGTVEVDVFDRVFERLALQRLDAMKIDVEGAELPVLRGAQAAIARHKPVILVEVTESAQQVSGHSSAALIAFLLELHYDIFLIGTRSRLTKVDSSTRLPAMCNVICYPR